MMVLPEELQQEFREELRRYQEESQMPLLSRIELEAKQEGLQEGILEGLQEGILRTLREDTIAILDVRFSEVTPEVIEVINTIENVPVLKQLLRQAIAIPSIEEFQQVVKQVLSREEQSTEES